MEEERPDSPHKKKRMGASGCLRSKHKQRWKRDGKEGDWSVVQKEGKVADAATVPTCPRGPFSRCGRMTERSTLADSAFSEGTLSVELQPGCGTHVAGGRRPVNAGASSSLQYLL
ncbi:hypothetical protein PVAP13_7NG256617 [Panicum virgatum]|uniref:Uncharacterized protein n=1 Tax=Panicum virgatum TaxID=38727 RepID=A0A8T0PXH0_PANVG|nr:hypothetical protein PVAP13_7NG256617 [Panicum virgatum]